MPAIATRPQKIGNVVKYEEGTNHGYCREMISVLLTPTSENGDVLRDNAGTFELVDAANVANAAAILIDNDVYDLRPDTGTATVEVAALVRGDAIVAEQALNYAADVDTPAERAAAAAALEALGILAREQV